MHGPEIWLLLGILAIIVWSRQCARGKRWRGSRRKDRREEYEQELSVKDSQIRDLKERVEVLERIVTDPRRDLNEQFNDIA